MGKKSCIVDSCFFIALLLEKDSTHENAVFLMEEIDKHNQRLIVFHRIIEEVITVLTYKSSMESVNNFLVFLQKKENIEIYNNNHFEELRFFQNEQKKLSFIDMSLLYQSMQYDLPILSFDKKLITLSSNYSK